jgi:outer membrane protein OmpA-like peptidoglycan-associated protein
MGSKVDESKALDTLRQLLLNPEKEQIHKIENRLDDPMVRAKELSQSLPDAISLSVLEGNKLSRVLQTVIDASLKVSVQNNPRAFADAISPALGPGIRKAISSTIMGMVQSLNQMLNHSVSIQGLKWRFEAFRTRKQFAEIVLLHTLVYQVEQIFLIHGESGIVLDHVVAKDIIMQDPDLVSGMLTAIQDFVKDSFNTQDDLETLRMGSDRSVWIEKGEHALIAAVIRGNPPLDMRINYRKLLEKIHIRSGRALEEFDGDPLPFSIFREELKDGLQFREKKEKKRISPFLWCVFLVIIGGIGFWGVSAFKENQTWHRYISRLEAQKGLIILSAQKTGGEYQIFGLRDPLATDPASLLPQEQENPIPIVTRWKTFYSLDPQFVFQRAEKILTPPETIKLELSGNLIIAKGQAGQNWITRFQNLSPTIPGINACNDEMIQNTDVKSLDIALKELIGIQIYFENNSIKLLKNQEAVLDQIIKVIHNIRRLQSKALRPVHIMILGHTDSSGNEKVNQRLSRDRAEKIFSHLIVHGINPAFLSVSGVGTKIPIAEENRTEDKQLNRVVTFKPFFLDLTKGSSQ